MQRKLVTIIYLTLSLWLVAVGVGRAQEGGSLPPPPADLDPAPWRRPAGLAGLTWATAAPDEEPEFLEVRVADDTFIARQYPFDWRAFGTEQSVWFGGDADLGWMWAMLKFDRPRLPAGARYLGAAIYLPIAGQKPAAELPTTAHAILGHWDGPTLTWQNRPNTQHDPLASFIIGRELGWYWFDFSDVFRRWYDGQFFFYGIAVRGPETASNIAKGMFSREAGDDKPVPTLVVAYLPDRTPPTCTIQPLPLVSPAPVTISFSCWDDQGVEMAEIQFRQQDGNWQTIPQTTLGLEVSFVQVFGVRGGKTYSFRLRAADRAGNFSDWTPDGAAVTTIESTPPVAIARDPGRLRAADWQPFPANFFEIHDPGPVASGIEYVEREYANIADGIWRAPSLDGSIDVTVGARYRFRARGVDRAGNVSGWAITPPVGIYLRQASGSVTDAAGRALAHLTLQITPGAMNTVKTDVNGRYQAYLVRTTAHTLTTDLPNYTLTAAAIPAGTDDVSGLAHRLLAGSNAVSNGAFDASLEIGWTLAGEAAVRTERVLGNGNPALRLGASSNEALTRHSLGAPGCLLTTPDGALHVAWVQADPNGVYYARRSAGGSWERTLVSGQGDPDAVWLPSGACILQADPQGNLHLVYAEVGWRWNYAIRNAITGDWTPNLRPVDSRIMHIKGLSTDANMTAHLLYETDANRLEYITYTLGVGWGEPVTITVPFGSSGSMYKARLLVTPEGVRHALWTERLYQSVWHSSSTDGRTWSVPQRLSSTPTNLASHLALVRAANGDLYAFWMEWSGSFSELVYARLPRGGVWSAPHPSPVPLAFNENSFYNVLVDAAGWWYLHLAPADGIETLYSGPSLDALTAVAALRSANGPAIIARSGSDTYLLRHIRPANRPGQPFAAHLLKLDPNRPASVITAGQAVTVPSLAPVLSAAWDLDWTNSGTTPAELTVELTDTAGGRHTLATLTANEGTSQPWADLTPWAGQPVTLTFSFDPRGDASALAWLDDVHLGGIPLDVKVSLHRQTLPVAGQPLTFTLTVANARPYSLTVPVELTWPPAWPLTTSVAPTHSAPGAARFDVHLMGPAQRVITGIVAIPTGTELTTATLSAAIGATVAAQDYTPADNRADSLLLISGRLIWLPIIMQVY